MLKLYSAEEVRKAIALLKERKRSQYVPNVAGYFVSALKGDWGARKPECIRAVRRRPSGGKSLVENGDREEQEIDRVAVFRHWYDLARELGYCQGQEIRDGEQWINLSGSWEKWELAVSRGYSLEYLKKIMKRNRG